ncbi:unnamed protein product, partial [Timema podura]|nr:unnamed protein product [Timema podura]
MMGVNIRNHVTVSTNEIGSKRLRLVKKFERKSSTARSDRQFLTDYRLWTTNLRIRSLCRGLDTLELDHLTTEADEEKVSKESDERPSLRKDEVETVFSYIQSWS